MGLTSLIEFSLQLFDYVNGARRKNPIFLYVSCFQICMGGHSPEGNSFLPTETLQLRIRFSPYKN